MAVAGPCWACHVARDGVENTPPRLERCSMREQASSRGTRSCRCCCLNRSQRAGSLCGGDARRAGRGLRPGAQPAVAATAPFARHNAVHTQGGSASPRPSQPIQADGGGRLIGPSPLNLSLLRVHAKTGRNARLPVRELPSHMLAHAALGKRELGNNLWTSRANERNDVSSSSALASQAPTTERPFVLPPVTDEDTRCLLASAIPTVSVQLRLYHSSTPSRAYGVTRR
jgi:hypothetical protein